MTPQMDVSTPSQIRGDTSFDDEVGRDFRGDVECEKEARQNEYWCESI